MSTLIERALLAIDPEPAQAPGVEAALDAIAHDLDTADLTGFVEALERRATSRRLLDERYGALTRG